MAGTGEDHGDTVFIGRSDDFLVAHRATRLDDGLGAGCGQHIDAVAEREEGIRRNDRTVQVEAGVLLVTRWIIDAPAPPTFVKAGGFTANVDRWQIIRFEAPCTVAIDVGVAVAPHQADPRTGEIFDADIAMSDAFARHARRIAREDLMTLVEKPKAE
mgnify:CR=1 FL=1